MTDDPTAVLVVDDHAVMGDALVMALKLQGFASARTVGGAEIDQAEVLAAAEEAGEGTVVVLDLHLGDGRLSTPMIGPLRERGARVLVLTAERSARWLGECLEAGADGVFDKAQPFDQLVDLLHDAARGASVMTLRAREDLLSGFRDARSRERSLRGPFETLTGRERDVLQGLVDGSSAEDIARSHSLALSTVRSHVKTLLRKLGVNSQLAAVALAREAGWQHTD